MALETHKYVSVPREVLCVRVTPQNMREVAAWCKGEISNLKADGSKGPRYIKVDVKNASSERHTRAYPGDWLLLSDKGFRVFMNKVFQESFRRVDSAESVMQETGIPAKKAAKKRPKKSGKKPRPINPVMAAAMKSAQEKLGAQEIVQGPHTVAPAFSDVEKKDVEGTDVKVIEQARLHSVSVVMDPPNPEWKIETMDAVSKHPEERTIENSLDRLTGLPASPYTPPEDLVPIPGAEAQPQGGAVTENQQSPDPTEHQDPSEPKRVDQAVETEQQAPEAQPVEPEAPTEN